MSVFAALAIGLAFPSAANAFEIEVSRLTQRAIRIEHVRASRHADEIIVPIHGIEPGHADGVALTIGFDPSVLVFRGIVASDLWPTRQIVLLNQNRIKLVAERYGGRSAPNPGSDDVHLVSLRFAISPRLDTTIEDALDADVYRTPLTLGGDAEESYFYAFRGVKRAKPLDHLTTALRTERLDGSVAVHLRDSVELGSGMVSPTAQEIALPLYLTQLKPQDGPLFVTVDYDQIFSRFDRALSVRPRLVGEASIGEETGRVTLVFHLDAEESATGGVRPILREAIATLYFKYFGNTPESGSLEFQAALLGDEEGLDDAAKGVAGGRVVVSMRHSQVYVLSPYYVRGNVDASDPLGPDGRFRSPLRLVDATMILEYLTGGLSALPCAAAADVNASGGVDVSDAVHLLTHLFARGAAPAAPYPEPGWLADEETDLECENSLSYYSLID